MSNPSSRREFLKSAAAGGLALTAGSMALGAAGAEKPKRPNILLITADDMNWDSLGVTGCKTPDITPNLDRLAGEGIRFERAYITTSLCLPSRASLMTGRYSHRSGAIGFKNIRGDVPTLGESLRAAGYLNGIMGKVNHITPEERFCWDVKVGAHEVGKNPTHYGHYAGEFFKKAKEEGRPFFFMANSHEPHRGYPPLAAALAPQERRKLEAQGIDRFYTPEEVEVPPFLPDIPVVRAEIAQFYTAVHRCDKIVGAILEALDDAGFRENTLVMFLSDNGMPFVFAKCNCYQNSNRTPWIVRWPGTVKAGRVDKKHFISSVDFAPTVLDVLGLEQMPGVDGSSFLPALRGKRQRGRDHVFTTFDQVTDNITGPIRCVTVKRYTYIYNVWYGREEPFCGGKSEGRTLPAMQEAAKTNPRIAARVEMHLRRVPDELYDIEKDPHALQNLVNDPAHRGVVKELRERLLDMMTSTNDLWLSKYREFLALKSA